MVELVLVERSQRSGQPRDLTWTRAVQNTVHAILDGVERAAGGNSDNGRAARLRLDRHDAEVFSPRIQERAAAPVEIAHRLVADTADEFRLRSGHRLARTARPTVSGNHERHAGPCRG
ncbi:MAG TPA: hypothetical protein VGI86_06705, partial [Acidimicrobiia bacterium]